MRKPIAIAILVLLGVVSYSVWLVNFTVEKVHAQSASALTIQGQGPHTTCLTPASGLYILCQATDGTWVSNNGAAYFQVLAPAASAVTLTLNGQTKTLPASFTIAAAAPSVSATAPAISAQ